MVKIQKISEIEPRLGFTEFDILKKYRHHKIFCVNVKYGIQYEFRIFLFDKFAK